MYNVLYDTPYNRSIVARLAEGRRRQDFNGYSNEPLHLVHGAFTGRPMAGSGMGDQSQYLLYGTNAVNTPLHMAETMRIASAGFIHHASPFASMSSGYGSASAPHYIGSGESGGMHGCGGAMCGGGDSGGMMYGSGESAERMVGGRGKKFLGMNTKQWKGVGNTAKKGFKMVAPALIAGVVATNPELAPLAPIANMAVQGMGRKRGRPRKLGGSKPASRSYLDNIVSGVASIGNALKPKPKPAPKPVAKAKKSERDSDEYDRFLVGDEGLIDMDSGQYKKVDSQGRVVASASGRSGGGDSGGKFSISKAFKGAKKVFNSPAFKPVKEIGKMAVSKGIKYVAPMAKEALKGAISSTLGAYGVPPELTNMAVEHVGNIAEAEAQKQVSGAGRSGGKITLASVIKMGKKALKHPLVKKGLALAWKELKKRGDKMMHPTPEKHLAHAVQLELNGEPPMPPMGAEVVPADSAEVEPPSGAGPSGGKFSLKSVSRAIKKVASNPAVKAIGKQVASTGVKYIAPLAKTAIKGALMDAGLPPALTSMAVDKVGDMAVAKANSAIAGAGRSGGASDGRAKRAMIVKKIMKERGVKMIEASKIVKAEGLY